MSRTLVIVKPDGVERGLVGTILARLEARGQVRHRLARLQALGPQLRGRAEVRRDGKVVGWCGASDGGEALASLRSELAADDLVEVEGQAARVAEVLG